MIKFHALTTFTRPGLHVWREGTSLVVNLHPNSMAKGPGWVTFEYDFEPQILHPTKFMLFEFDEKSRPLVYEKPEHQRTLPRLSKRQFPSELWFAQDTNRVLQHSPEAESFNQIKVHLHSLSRYRPSQLYVWDPISGASSRVEQSGIDELGPFFQISLRDDARQRFLFKFIRRAEDGSFSIFEPDAANRLWSSSDGGTIWTHSESPIITSTIPRKCILRVNYRQEFAEPPKMRVWQEGSDYTADIAPAPEVDGWYQLSTEVYLGIDYGIQFWNPGLPEEKRWENVDAIRSNLVFDGPSEFWTLEGDPGLFKSKPKLDRKIELKIVAKPPFSKLGKNLSAHVWINRARGGVGLDVPVSSDGLVSLLTYPEVTTSIKFHDQFGRWEGISRHTTVVARGERLQKRFVVLERQPLLEAEPPSDQFTDPPYMIRRPGVYQEDNALRFAVHAPHHSRARVIGTWTNWLDHPVEMRSTKDGAYWWASIPVSDVLKGLGANVSEYHGEHYQFVFNDGVRYQDPAAGWVETSWNQGNSRLVQSDRFTWHDQNWQRPGWESLIIYQLHAARFTNRYQTDAPLRRVAREIDDAAGYLKGLGVTAIQLLPVNEVGSTNSWGYDPSYFYAIERDLGGPDALKELVDTCHKHGLAVLLDVVFNHAGTMDNILWEVAGDSFFDGDTVWGAMINFDQPQVKHFFAQNLAYLAQEFHIDGFRMDHTATIIHSAAWDPWSGFVRKLGSGGGWEFMQAIRHTLISEVDARCILIGEHLPNEWRMTNHGGPLDSQWCDNYHDRLIDACRRLFDMGPLADAMKLSQTACDAWYNVTNYSESHDEVGNVRDRVSYVAGFGQGFRMSKVAATAVLLSRGIPLYFMGAESAEDRQFLIRESDSLDLDSYVIDPDRSRIRDWWKTMALLHRNQSIQGPSPLRIVFAKDQMIVFTRGDQADFFVLLNFGGWSGSHNLGGLNLPAGSYHELWNSTWPAFRIASESEDEHSNGGRDVRLNQGSDLNIPDYGAVVLERSS